MDEPLLPSKEDAEQYSIQIQGFGDIKYGVNLADTLPRMESRKSIRMYRGVYAKTKPLKIWALFSCLTLLWGFSSLSWKDQAFTISFQWDFKDTVFGTAPSFTSITAVLWVLSILLLFYYVKYQVVYRVKSAIYITQFAIVAMFGAIWFQQAKFGGEYQSMLQSAVQIIYLLVMTLFVSIRVYQINFLPVWQDRNMFLTVPLLRACPEQTVVPKLLCDYSGKLLSEMRWCAYDCVGIWGRILPRSWVWRFKVMYVGEVDDHLRPHGFGEWWDTEYHGEHLVGLWQSGKPVGPFKSREKGSSSGFNNFRIGYFMNRADPLDKRLLCPTFAPEGERSYGVLSVECSVSGVFFKDYPRVLFLDGPHIWEPDDPFPEKGNAFRDKSDAQALSLSLTDHNDPSENLDEQGDLQWRRSRHLHKSWVVQRIERSPSLKRWTRVEDRKDTVTISAHPNRGLVVSGYERIGHKSKDVPRSIGIKLRSSSRSLDTTNDWTTTGLDVVGWEAKTNHGKYEALVFIHGFNAAVADAACVFGQFLALSNLPPYIKPIIFSWPGGSQFSYVQARLVGIEAEDTVDAFLELMRFLAEDGFSAVHIMAHSMGARVVTGCAVELEKILPGVNESQSGKLPLRIMSITLLSPDCDLEPFREDIGHRFRNLCPLVTIYGDRTDYALDVAELANWAIDFFLVGNKKKDAESSPGNGAHSNSDPGGSMEGSSGGQESVTSQNGRKRYRGFGSRLEKVLADKFPEQSRFVFSVFGKSAQKFEFMRKKTMKKFQGFTANIRRKNLGRVTDRVTDAATGDPLDIDVIDTSYMDANVHSIRHNYFSLNRELVADIRDLLVTQCRAHQRTSRLEWLGGNVFAFLVAPTYVVNP